MTDILAAALVALALTGVRLPPTLAAPADVRDLMERMLQQSPTFRRQIERLSAHRVYVRIRRDVCLVDKPYRARTTIRRTVAGPIIAMVDIGPVGDATEWIGHELEHVLEQVDGVRLHELARRDTGAAWEGAGGAFETDRAMRAGRLVAKEVRHAPRLAARHAPAPLDPVLRGDD